MEILCYLIASYGDYLIMWCVIVNLANFWIVKAGAEPDKFIIGMFLLGLVLIAISVILVLLGLLSKMGLFSDCLKDVFI